MGYFIAALMFFVALFEALAIKGLIAELAYWKSVNRNLKETYSKMFRGE